MGAFIAFSTTGANTILKNNFATGNNNIYLGLMGNNPATTMAAYTAVGHITAAVLNHTNVDTLNNVSANKVIGTTTPLTFQAPTTALTATPIEGAFIYANTATPAIIGGWDDPTGSITLGTSDTYNVTFTAATMISLAPA